MSTDWRWEYGHDHVAGGIPSHVVTEVERLAGRLAGRLVDLAGTGVDVSDIGNGPPPAGLRRMDAAGGWFSCLVAPREPLIAVVRIVPPFEAL
ncbi:hypothetical protein ACFZAG_09475 [Streptomyces sp. NPDC012403]|uniref:hypothetical protein n=1 Tax=Streptomyces sp. NPDC012403 TaxID=3364831 RepID=UPI0036E24F42